MKYPVHFKMSPVRETQTGAQHAVGGLHRPLSARAMRQIEMTQISLSVFI